MYRRQGNASVTLRHVSCFLFAACLVVSFLSCASISPASQSVDLPAPLTLTFSGDIMAHTVNYQMARYDDIYEDVAAYLLGDDITFGNLETPVDDSRPLSTWPRFNVHTDYVAAAYRAGFDAFSLANNHTNDQGSSGVHATKRACLSLSGSHGKGRKAWVSGVRDARGEEIVPTVISIRGFTVLFVAITEILNSHDPSGDFVYYVSPDGSSRKSFTDFLARVRREVPCDALILSIHCNEPEYVTSVSSDKKAWFAELARSGADVVWGNHPHVTQSWEIIDVPERDSQAVLLYSLGNFISGQRFSPAYENPGASREYTGDSVLARITLRPWAKDVRLDILPITNYTDPGKGVVVRRFSPEFVDSLSPLLRRYFERRYSLMASYLPLLPLRPEQAILPDT